MSRRMREGEKDGAHEDEWSYQVTEWKLAPHDWERRAAHVEHTRAQGQGSARPTVRKLHTFSRTCYPILHKIPANRMHDRAHLSSHLFASATNNRSHITDNDASGMSSSQHDTTTLTGNQHVDSVATQEVACVVALLLFLLHGSHSVGRLKWQWRRHHCAST